MHLILCHNTDEAAIVRFWRKSVEISRENDNGNEFREKRSPSCMSALRRQINHYNRFVSKASTQYYSNNISSYNNDPKKLWIELHKILHKRKVIIFICTLLTALWQIRSLHTSARRFISSVPNFPPLFF